MAIINKKKHLKSSASFFEVGNKLRSQKALLSLQDITKEVEVVRKKRHGK
jgi:hypothetical protein